MNKLFLALVAGLFLVATVGFFLTTNNHTTVNKVAVVETVTTVVSETVAPTTSMADSTSAHKSFAEVQKQKSSATQKKVAKKSVTKVNNPPKIERVEQKKFQPDSLAEYIPPPLPQKNTEYASIKLSSLPPK